MTANSGEYVDFVLERLAVLDGLRAGRFFGGTGLWCEDLQFAMLMGNTLYFAVDDATRESYLLRGSRPFTYMTGRGRITVEKYYEVPPELLEDEPALLALARESIAAAARARKPQTASAGSRSGSRTGRGRR
jgi:DNA transformation protein